MITLTGYGDRLSVRPGESIGFKVSAEDEAPYRVDVVRIRCGDLNPDGPGVRESVVASGFGGEHAGRRQVARSGSSIVVPFPDSLSPLERFSVTAMVWPTRPTSGSFQTVLSCRTEDGARGFSFGLDANGALALAVGRGGARRMPFDRGSRCRSGVGRGSPRRSTR